MSRIESGAHAAQAMQVPVSIAIHDKIAGKRSAAAGPIQQPGSTATGATIRVRSDFVQLQSINDQQSRVASQIRGDDQQLRQSDQLLGQMKRVLSDIIKYYPPYPAGETERVKFLRSFSAMRQQIEQLTIPPEETWKGGMPGDSLPQSETIQAENPSGGAAAAVVPGVATTFDIPELPDMVDNAPIETTLNRIENARATIAGRRAAIAEQVSINQSEGYSAKTEELKRTSREAWDLVLPTENEAEQNSIEAGSGLEQATSGSITAPEMQHLLLSLAG